MWSASASSHRTLFWAEGHSSHQVGLWSLWSCGSILRISRKNNNRQPDRANLESALRCVTAHHPAFWSTHLSWDEYAHNSMVSSPTSMSSFTVSLDFQTTLFRAQEHVVTDKSTVLSLHLEDCLSCTPGSAAQNQQITPAPPYLRVQEIWLASWDLPLQVDSHKLTASLPYIPFIIA